MQAFAAIGTCPQPVITPASVRSDRRNGPTRGELKSNRSIKTRTAAPEGGGLSVAVTWIKGSQ